ncbi:hypothetical protein [Aestuariibacter salexigens]|uniref:hypothetical protein n=1 Tax=Aestuariibacter salexigens TaxID=226010 RepID=UPI00042A2CB4|nr:hypothetical protein [Aestuariibacter salexigens]
MQIIHYELIVIAAFLLSITIYAAFSAQLASIKSDADVKHNEYRLRFLAVGAGLLSLTFMMSLINLYNGKVNGFVGDYLFDLYHTKKPMQQTPEHSGEVNEFLPA